VAERDTPRRPHDEDELFREEVQRDMGASADKVARQGPVKRRVFELLYDQRTELFILFLIVVSVVLLVLEVALPADQHAGWMSAIDRIGGEGFAPTALFWVDVGLTLVFAAE